MMDTRSVLVLIYLFCGIYGSEIFLEVYKNKTKSVYETSQTVRYVEDEAVKLTCSIVGSTVVGGEYPILTWVEGANKWTPPSNGISITTTKMLKSEDDGNELECRATSKGLHKEWSISAHFEKKKSPQEILKAQSNLFQILLISIGGVIGGTILLLSLYRLFLHCRKKHTSSDEKVMYSDADKTESKSKDELTGLGFDNVACKENDTYVSFDAPDSGYDTYTNDKTLKLESPEEKSIRGNTQRDVRVILGQTEDSDC